MLINRFSTKEANVEFNTDAKEARTFDNFALRSLEPHKSNQNKFQRHKTAIEYDIHFLIGRMSPIKYGTDKYG